MYLFECELQGKKRSVESSSARNEESIRVELEIFNRPALDPLAFRRMSNGRVSRRNSRALRETASWMGFLSILRQRPSSCFRLSRRAWKNRWIDRVRLMEATSSVEIGNRVARQLTSTIGLIDHWLNNPTSGIDEPRRQQEFLSSARVAY